MCAPTRNTSCCKKRSIKLTRNIKKAVKKSAVKIDICGNALVDFTLSADNLRSQSFNSLIKIDLLLGNDIKKHLEGCHTAVMMCATIGSEIDKLIRISQISDMARAVVLDSFASVAVEQVCQKVDEILAEKYSGKYMTFRFSPGYGDYPIEMQKEYLRILDAPRKIGLTTGDSCLLVPSKSVTAVLGISDNPIERRKRGCAICSMKGKCRFRRNGEHCGV